MRGEKEEEECTQNGDEKEESRRREYGSES
jgi:hypothetical protein